MLTQPEWRDPEDFFKYDETLDRFHALYLRYFQKYAKSHENRPKLHLLVHFPLFVRLFGVPRIWDVSHFEMFHKVAAKLPFKFDNHHEGESDRMFRSFLMRQYLQEVLIIGVYYIIIRWNTYSFV